MTRENAIRMLIAMVKCIDLEVSGTSRCCNNNQCDICRLNYEKGTMGEQKDCFKMAIKALQADIAMDFITLSEKLQHEIEEQDETINCLQDENKKLHRNINDLQSELVGATNDYKQTVNEVKNLNKQIDMLQRNVGYLCEENRKLRDTINAYEQLF